MTEQRRIHRRQFIPITRFPLHTPRGGLVTSERRRLPTRRLNDIVVREISFDEFISGMH
jgi:hypothetical protein